MVVHCCVPLCTNTCSDDVSFHGFPTPEKRKWLWLHAMKRDKGGKYHLNDAKEEFYIKSTTRVCSAHFTKFDFVTNAKKKCLIRTAVPSIFEWTSDSTFTITVDTDEELSDEEMKVDAEIISSKYENDIKKICYVPCDCSPLADEENDSEVEEIIIERQIDDNMNVENNKINNFVINNDSNDDIEPNESATRLEQIDIMESLAIKKEIGFETKLDDIETESNICGVKLEIKHEFLDIPCDADAYRNSATYCSDVTYIANSDVPSGSDVNENIKQSKLIKNIDKIKTREIKNSNTKSKQILTKVGVTEALVPTKLNNSLQKIKKHIIQKKKVFLKRNCKSKNDGLTPTAAPMLSINLPIFTIEKFRYHNKSINYYTGLKSFDMFHLIFTYVLPSGNADHVYIQTRNTVIVRNYNLSGMNQFFMTLMKLKQNFDFNMISDLFCVTEKIVKAIFKAWIQYLYIRLTALIQWPHRDILLKNELYRNMIGGLYIIKLNVANVCKKGLIMHDPDLNLIFVSPLFCDSLTAKQLMQQSFFLREITRKYQLGELLGSDVIVTGETYFDVKSFVKWKEADEIDIVEVDVNNRRKDLNFADEKRTNVKKVLHKINVYGILNEYDSASYAKNQFNEIYAVCCSLSFFQHS